VLRFPAATYDGGYQAHPADLVRLAAQTGESFSAVAKQAIMVSWRAVARPSAVTPAPAALLRSHVHRPRAAGRQGQGRLQLLDKGRCCGLTGRSASRPGSRMLLEQVRQQDFCAASEEHELGVHAVAVPLRDMDGRTVAALNLVTTRQRMEPRSLQKDLLPLLWEAAR
jgi:IclR family pca regulon transcriptional regulator